MKLTEKGSKEAVTATMNEIKKDFEPFSPVVFPGFISKVRNEYRMHAMLTVAKGLWPHPEILLLLAGLTLRVSVQLEPDSLILMTAEGVGCLPMKNPYNTFV